MLFAYAKVLRLILLSLDRGGLAQSYTNGPSGDSSCGKVTTTQRTCWSLPVFVVQPDDYQLISCGLTPLK
jgi:hypothetical protein